MDYTQAKHRIEQLRAILWENSRKYYVENAPTMSDYEYDQLMHELEDWERRYPQYDSPDSPTHRVGSDLEEKAESGGFAKYPHKYPMLSLSNTYSIQEVEEFAERAAKSLDKPFTYCCELKFDGTAICLTYKNGRLFRALTRGDGVQGDDVTRNALQIASIPEALKGSGWPEEFEIRGEVLMPYESFDRLNAEREAQEEPLFANPRNAASGSLKLQDPEEVGRRGLFCTLYHIPTGQVDFPTHDAALKAAAEWGLPVSAHRRICSNIQEIEAFIEHWDTARKELPFATDGIVIKINEMDCQQDLGYTAKSPRWAVAYKFKAEQACTPILSIDYQVGRTGAVTPVANLEPVLLSGTMVKRATLVNEDQIRALDIHEGDWVYVEKGGEIIPKITGVEESKRQPGAVIPRFPQVCPDCGTPLVREEGEAKWFCPNRQGCPTQIKGRLEHFVSRKAMNILCGEATIEQLYNLNLVTLPSHLYTLKADQLVMLEGWKDRAAARFLDSVKASLDVPFERVLFAIGIRFVGETTARDVARHFGSIDAIASATKEELLEVPEVGEVIADSIFHYFLDVENCREVEALRAAGLRMSMEEGAGKQSDALAGKSIVISGNFSISRDAMKALIEAHGGKNSSSVSGKTDYLLAGTKPGPEKLKKAADLGIQVIDEETFMRMIGDTLASLGMTSDAVPEEGSLPGASALFLAEGREPSAGSGTSAEPSAGSDLSTGTIEPTLF
ncbi:MAG: NAD-dependent DNA ligase LigA [Bacteroidales bacterium]|nr:NAD-dependent DNA ligase LigA [Bacteroidales bacterium]